MKNFLTVVKFTIEDLVSRKAFTVTTIIFTILILLLANIPGIIDKIESNDEKTRILFIDQENIFSNSLLDVEQLNSTNEITFKNEKIEIEEVKNMITNNEIDEAYIVNNEESGVKIIHIVENAIDIYGSSEMTLILDTIYKNNLLSELGLSQEEMQKISSTINYEDISVSNVELNEGNIFISTIATIVLFTAIYIFAYQVSMSITTEKTSKIMETLVTSTSPETIVIGKTIGVGVLGLIQIIWYLIVGAISIKIFVDPELISRLIEVINLSPSLIIFTIIYFLLGYFLFAFLYALTASMVTKQEDIQTVSTPVAVLAVLGYYLAIFTGSNPESALASFASLLPISSPFAMISRMLIGIAGTSEIILSIIILIITIVIIAKIAIKVYSNAILNYGMKFNLKNIIKLYKTK